MSASHEVVFLSDCDNTLLDNDRVEEDLRTHLAREFGRENRDRYWKIFERPIDDCFLDLANIAAYPPADLTIQRIRDLVNADLAALLGNDAVGRA